MHIEDKSWTTVKRNGFQRRLDLSYCFLQQCNNPRFLSNIVINDEASFEMNGAVYTWNIRECIPKGQVIYEKNGF